MSPPDTRTPRICFVPIEVFHSPAGIEENRAGVAALVGFVKCAVIGDEGAAIEVIENVGPCLPAAATTTDIGGLTIHIDHLVLGHADAWRTGAFLLIAGGGFVVLLRAGGFAGGGSGPGAAVGFSGAGGEECGGEGEKEGGFHGR